MTSITWAGPRCVQGLAAILGPQNRTQGRCETGAATSYNSRGGLSFAHLFSGSTPAHAMIIHKTASFIIHHISHFSMFPMALGTM